MTTIAVQDFTAALNQPYFSDGPWQNLSPPLYGSPPSSGRIHRSGSTASADSKPQSFIDIVNDEIRNRKIAIKSSKKPFNVIQVSYVLNLSLDGKFGKSVIDRFSLRVRSNVTKVFI